MHLSLKKGALHKTLGVAKEKKIPVAAERRAAHSRNALTRKRAQFALNSRRWKHK